MCPEEFRKIIWSKVNKFARKTHINEEELLCEANLAFTIASKQFDPNKGMSFKSWLFLRLDQELNRYISKEITHKEREVDLNPTSEQDEEAEQSIDPVDWLNPSKTNDPDRIYSFRESLERLSDTAQDVIHEVFKKPTDALSNTPYNSRAKLREKLKDMGWHEQTIREAFNEIRTTIRSMPV